MSERTTAGMKRRKDSPIEGFTARWYAATTRKDMQEFQDLAERLIGRIGQGERVLEVAPGPGYLSIELARRGIPVTGLDLSHSFVRIAAWNAREAVVDVDFRRGNAAAMPFDGDIFDLIVCRAAFKNFADPVKALDEMHRVLKPGGSALIIDLRKDASVKEIDRYIDGTGRNRIDALLTRLIFRHVLIPRAYSRSDFEGMASQSRFATCTIDETLIGFEVWFGK